MVHCTYCRELFAWNQGSIQSAGKRAVLMEGFTRLYRGATGTVNQNRFEVLGRVRYDFGGGFWDEWFLNLSNGQSAWLTEDDHQLAWQTPIPWEQSFGGEGLQPGSQVQHQGVLYIVHEVGRAKCLGVEGTLPRALLPGEAYRYADASTPDGRFTLGLEFDDSPPSAYVGRWLDHQQLQLDDEGDEW